MGKIYEQLEYTPYGELWVEHVPVVEATPFRFTRKERDSETGLYYYGTRYLNPQTGMWLSADPAMGEYIPQVPINDEAKQHNKELPGMGGVFNYVNLHAYHYAGNNPVKLTDPDGRGDVPGDYITNEPKVKEYLQQILDDPNSYKIEFYQRKAMGKGKRTELRTHSFYVITDKEGKKTTLSFNGDKYAFNSEGAWAVNTEMDVESLELFKVDGYDKKNNPYDVVKMTPEGGINVATTIRKIIEKIDSSTTYYMWDHRTNLPGKDNCNTALYETMTLKRRIR